MLQKQLKRAFVATVIMLLVPFLLHAQTARFEDVRQEINVPDDSKRLMTRLHFTLYVDGGQGHNIQPVMFVECPKGVEHHYANGSLMRVLCNTLYCQWENTHTTGDWWTAIYYDGLNPKAGNNEYFVRLGAWDDTTKQWIGFSDYNSFTFTGSQQQQSPSYMPQIQDDMPCVGCGGTKKCSVCNGKGMTVSYSSRKMWHECGACNGTGICQTCRFR